MDDVVALLPLTRTRIINACLVGALGCAWLACLIVAVALYAALRGRSRATLRASPKEEST